MRKKILPILLIAPMLLSGCTIIIGGGKINSGGSSGTTGSSGSGEFTPITSTGDDGGNTKVDEPTLEISNAEFIDKNGHLKVTYTCNYLTPFNVANHTFAKLNITGVTASEIDYSHEGYFTVLSPVVATSLKFEFYDTNDTVYLMKRYQDVKLFDESKPVVNIDFPAGYNTLYWSDEFNGTSLDTNNWTYEIGNGNGGWGNNEAQYYTNNNEYVANGVLNIQAKKQTISSWNYTSTRIKTQNKVKFTYGYIEAKIALPTVQGMWPAFWMMPNDSVYGGWPHSGEIDIMDAKGRINNQSSSALHFSNLSGQHTYLANERNGHNIAEFHKYAVEWKADTIKYLIDDEVHYVIHDYQWSTSGNPSSTSAPFDRDFYIILNLAVGGHFDNYRMPPEDFTSAAMKVDYVRVFK